jgi:hypothetical protein
MAPLALFRELVWHFFGRFFDKESLSPQGQPEAGVIRTLGMLAPPSGFVCILAMVLHPQRWELVGLRFLFICYSMIAMGVVMVFEWDALFPDRRDYLILTPLPLRAFTLFAAKMAALGIFLVIFVAAINCFGVLFWPGVESRGNFFAVAGAHLAVMAAAGLFSALAIAALQGVLATVFRGAAYRRISVCAQTAVMAALIMFLFLSPLMGSSLGQLCQSNSPYLRWFPGFWFAGLYEQVRPAVSRAGSPAAAEHVLSGLGTVAVRSIWIAVAIFTVTFLPGYRRHMRRVLEAPEPNPKGPGRAEQALGAAMNRLLRDPVECGVFHFIGATLARSLKHRLFLATYGGFGAALVVIMLAAGGSSLRIPLTLSFILISGLRAAFNFPSDLRANWAFQVSETSSVAAYIRATRKWVMLYAILPLFLLLAAIEAVRSPWTATAFHFAFGVVVSIVLMEALFTGFHKAPFTCSHFPGKVNLVFLSVLYFFGFTFYSTYMASLEEWLWAMPAMAAVFFPAIGGSLVALGRTRERMLGGEAGLEYEDDGNPAVRTLGLTEQ